MEVGPGWFTRKTSGRRTEVTRLVQGSRSSAGARTEVVGSIGSRQVGARTQSGSWVAAAAHMEVGLGQVGT